MVYRKYTIVLYYIDILYYCMLIYSFLNTILCVPFILEKYTCMLFT